MRGVAQRDALLAEARAELDRALKIGGPGRFTEQVVGSFRLGVLIGRGGMGEVYEAHAVADRREAAVKLLHPGHARRSDHGRSGSSARPQTASRLDTPVRRARARGRHHRPARSRSSRWSGCAATTSPTSSAASAGSSSPQARAVAEQVALGLEAARTAGIVHRDLKPHNVFLAEQDGERRWKILDFGVSKSGGSGTLTKGHVVGTPAYMAPEQARGEDVDHRADVYSLAAILYRSVTGHPAFTGKDVPTHALRRRLSRSRRSRRSSRRSRPTSIACSRSGSPRTRADRFATALELAEWFAARDRGPAVARAAPPRGRADRPAAVGHAARARAILAIANRHCSRAVVPVEVHALIACARAS